jgi:hypothetical protein
MGVYQAVLAVEGKDRASGERGESRTILRAKQYEQREK